MSDGRFDVLERFERLLQAPEPSFEGFLRQRDRKRRDQRIAAGVVAIAILVAPVWLVATGGRPGRVPTPGTNGSTVPSVTVDDPGMIGLVGLAPEGATPSTPKTGELVLSFMFGHTMGDPGRFGLFLYADGRLIWQRLGDATMGWTTTGLVEQRLTPEGVKLLKGEVVSSGLAERDLHLIGAYGLNFGQIEIRDGSQLIRVTWGEVGQHGAAEEMATPEQVSALERLDARLEAPASWLPPSAWEDNQIRAFVPSRYSVCYEAERGIGLSRVLSSLPRRAEELLRSWDRSRSHLDQPYPEGPSDIWCSDVSTEEAHVLAQILDDAGRAHQEDVFGLRYVFGQRGPGATEVLLSFAPLLPHQT